MTDKIRKIECEQAIVLLMQFLDRELDTPDHDAMQAHLDTCRACYTRMEFEKRLKGRISQLPTKKASDSLRDRIKTLSKKF